MASELLGIDIGGSGIKGALVDIESGQLKTDRYRLATPQPSKPKAVAEAVNNVVRHFDYKGPIGYGFPAIVRNGVTQSAANVHQGWVGTDANMLFTAATGCPSRVLNDADVAGMAEMKFGAGRGRAGTVLIITIGTGLGSALFRDGILVPNCEFGHIQIDGLDAETRASDAARKRDELSWKQWSKHFDTYLNTLEFLISPDLFILGGGASKKFHKFGERLTVAAEVMPAQLLNEAGIVGAALAAKDMV